MILIADSGGTGTDWCTVSKEIVCFYQSEGLPPSVVKNGVTQPPFLLSIAQSIECVYFYGTGCATIEKARVLRELLDSWFPQAQVHVFSDLLALAHIGLGFRPGYVSILGTGASMAYYDGSNLHFSVRSRGVSFDPGSGTDLANCFHKDFFEGRLSKDLENMFCKHYSIVNKEYPFNIHETMHFLRENVSHRNVSKLIRSRFESFFNYYMAKAIDEKSEVVFGGSVAYIFSELLLDVAVSRDILISAIYPNPIYKLAELNRYT